MALTDQLMGKYLRDCENRWGILLIVHQISRPTGWRKTDGTFIGISEVVEHRTSNIEHRTSNIEHRTSNIEHLTLMANSIAFNGRFAVQMDVALIDVSASMQPAVQAHPAGPSCDVE